MLADVLLGDSSIWPSWTPIESFDLERPGGADGLGEVRVFTTGRVRVREEIVERQAARRLTYTLLSGLAVRDYRAVIDLTPRRGGTEIRWHTTFRGEGPRHGVGVPQGAREGDAAVVNGLAEQSAER